MSIQAELRFVTLSLLPYSLASNASRQCSLAVNGIAGHIMQ